MSTDITVVNRRPAPLARVAPSLGIEGLEMMTTDDLVLPRWSIIQNTSKKPGADDHQGYFHRNLDGLFVKKIEAAVLTIRPARLKWKQALGGNPDCTSHDRVNGSTYGACNTCQFNRRYNLELAQEYSDGNTKAHEVCNEGWTVVIVDDLEVGSPAILGAISTSAQAPQIFATQLKWKYKCPPFARHVTIESERKENAKGKFFVLKMIIGEPFDPEEMAMWREMSKAMTSVTIKDIEADEPNDTEGPYEEEEESEAPSEAPPVEDLPQDLPF